MDNKLTNEILKIKDNLDKISINSEVIENYNKLTCDKLQELNELNIHQDKDSLLVALLKLTRYSESYITLNYSITDEINKINNNIRLINNQLNKLLENNK